MIEFESHALQIAPEGRYRQVVAGYHRTKRHGSGMGSSFGLPRAFDDFAPPLQADFAGARLADQKGYLQGFKPEGIERQRRFAGRTWKKQPCCIARPVFLAHHGGTMGKGIPQIVSLGRSLRHTASRAAATARFSASITL